ncbi:MAG: STT3 domain-containing protein [Patescibacteria group bacterium]|jgi:hypothetical protein
MVNFIKKYWQEICVVALAAGFFVAAAFFVQANSFSSLSKWNSPDEAANYFFTKNYAETGELSYFEPANLVAGDVVIPRSMRSDNGTVKPVSFLGIILIYGFLAKIFSVSVFPYLTPFFAALGIIFFYLFFRRIFDKGVAFFSVFLLAFFPPYFYYSVRGFFHNILFVVLLLIGLYFSLVGAGHCPVQVGEKKKFFSFDWQSINWRGFLFSSLGGFFIGLTLLTRASEALWLLSALFIAWIFNFKKVGLLKLLLFISFAAVAFLPQISWNQILYGGFTRGGYTEMNKSITSIAQNSSSVAVEVSRKNFSAVGDILKKIKTDIFYFGFNPEKSRLTFDNYFIKMFPWLFWPAIFGLIVFLVRFFSWKKRHWAYLLSFLISAIVLILYYGSWDFHDNPDPKSITIGNSYTRYWLPVYIGLMPLATSFILRLTWAIFPSEEDKHRESEFWLRQDLPLGVPDVIEGENAVKSMFARFCFGQKKFFSFSLPSANFLIGTVRVILLIIYFYVSVMFVFGASEEGLAYFSVNRKTSLNEYQEVLDLTEENSIIITRYHDKLFFPARTVSFGDLSNKELNDRYAQLARIYPVYYFNFNLYDFALVDLNKKLSASGLFLKKIKKVNNAFALYQLTNIKSPLERGVAR